MNGDFVETIEWSGEQLTAIDQVLFWYEQTNGSVFFLSGYAGTGKTTLALEVKRRIGGNVIFTSVTGRACSVMARKGCAPVDTVDYLIYTRQRIEFCADDPPCGKVCASRC